MRTDNRAIVIGCGVNGLTCAIKLQELGIEVEIWTRDRPERTVSMVAASVWHPYLVFPEDRVARWATSSFEAFAWLATEPDTGIWLAEGVVITPEPVKRPTWAIHAMDVRCIEASPNLPAHYTLCAPIIETPTYIPWLLNRFEQGGGAVVDREVASFDEPFERARVVINCAGLGARTLARDVLVRPVKGQIVRLAAGAFDRFLFDERDPAVPTYMIPRRGDCILGGTAEPGADDTGTSESAQRSIIERCARLVPSIADAEVLGSIAGVRPARDEVRLEPEIIEGRGLLVHNYGHGGAGITLSIGCANEVKSIVAMAIEAPTREKSGRG